MFGIVGLGPVENDFKWRPRLVRELVSSSTIFPPMRQPPANIEYSAGWLGMMAVRHAIDPANLTGSIGQSIPPQISQCCVHNGGLVDSFVSTLRHPAAIPICDYRHAADLIDQLVCLHQLRAVTLRAGW
jgi:hypothetical protein